MREEGQLTGRSAQFRAHQRDVQFKDAKYDPVLTAADKPAIHLNAEVMERMRPKLSRR